MSEEELVLQFCESISGDAAPWKTLGLLREFDYARGRTDVVMVDSAGRVIAIEAKLQRWRQALHQAYRNGCFAHVNYILLPPRAAALAQRFPDEFLSRSVGLCSVSEGDIKILIEAEEQLPLQPYLTARAKQLTISATSD